MDDTSSTKGNTDFLKEREVVAREREVELKAQEINRSRWLNPVVLGLFAATAGLIGNIVVARVNNANTQDVERLRLQSNLILEAIKTDPKSACTNLVFLVGLGLVEDGRHTIREACESSSSQKRPSIQSMTNNDIYGVVKDEKGPIEGARVVAVGLKGYGDGTDHQEYEEDRTDVIGQFYLHFPKSIRVVLHIERQGYEPRTVSVESGGRYLVTMARAGHH
jgi:hypothetical protein